MYHTSNIWNSIELYLWTTAVINLDNLRCKLGWSNPKVCWLSLATLSCQCCWRLHLHSIPFNWSMKPHENWVTEMDKTWSHWFWFTQNCHPATHRTKNSGSILLQQIFHRSRIPGIRMTWWHPVPGALGGAKSPVLCGLPAGLWGRFFYCWGEVQWTIMGMIGFSGGGYCRG
jgi:hypothetical protein